MPKKLLPALLLPVACLIAQPDKTAWEVLKTGFSDKNIDTRRQAVTATGSIGLDPEALRLVEQSLRDPDPLVRQTAAAQLGQMKAKDAIPSLKTALDDASPEVAFAAAKALWDIGDKSGRDLIEDVLTGQEKAADGYVSSTMRDVKRKMHDPKALALMGIKEAQGALLGPFNIGVVAAEQAFRDGSGGSRALATTLLAQDCDTEALRLLQWSCANDKNWAVKAASAKALGQCGNADAIPTLEVNLTDSHPATRFMAAGAIVRLSAKR
jgi:HEAT repeat protein